MHSQPLSSPGLQLLLVLLGWTGSQWVGPLGDTLHIGEEMDPGEDECRMASTDLGVTLNDLSWSDASEFLYHILIHFPGHAPQRA